MSRAWPRPVGVAVRLGGVVDALAGRRAARRRCRPRSRSGSMASLTTTAISSRFEVQVLEAPAGVQVDLAVVRAAVVHVEQHDEAVVDARAARRPTCS